MTLESLDSLDNASTLGIQDSDAKWKPMQLGQYQEQHMVKERNVKALTSCRGPKSCCT
jgi:hypothetical protein